MYDLEMPVLKGKHVELHPLNVEQTDHLAKCALDEDIWRYLRGENIVTKYDFSKRVKLSLAQMQNGLKIPFVIYHKSTERYIGETQIYNIDEENRSVEMGNTWIASEFQRTFVNTETKFLLLCHLFDELKILRVVLMTDARNIRSQKAIERLGAIKEGRLRKHLVLRDGYIRDSIIYSIVDDDWMGVKMHLKYLLHRRYSKTTA